MEIMWREDEWYGSLNTVYKASDRRWGWTCFTILDQSDLIYAGFHINQSFFNLICVSRHKIVIFWLFFPYCLKTVLSSAWADVSFPFEMRKRVYIYIKIKHQLTSCSTKLSGSPRKTILMFGALRPSSFRSGRLGRYGRRGRRKNEKVQKMVNTRYGAAVFYTTSVYLTSS